MKKIRTLMLTALALIMGAMTAFASLKIRPMKK